jgi:hypothetical protein
LPVLKTENREVTASVDRTVDRTRLRSRATLRMLAVASVGLTLGACSAILGLDGLEPRKGDGGLPDAQDASVGDAMIDGNDATGPISCSYRCSKSGDAVVVLASCDEAGFTDAGVCNGQCTQAGRCLEAIASSGHPDLLVLDTYRVYWTSPGDGGSEGSVQSCGLDGSLPSTIATGLAEPTGIAIDDANVFWSDTAAGVIYSYAKDGGAVSQVVVGIFGPSDVVVGNRYLYWGELFTKDVQGAPLTDFARATTFANEQGSPLFLAVDSENLYWTNPFLDQSLVRLALDGGTPFTIAHGIPFQLAVDKTSLYWTDLGTGLEKTAKNGNGATITNFSSAANASALALDDGNIYWGTKDGFIARATVAGQDTTTLASGQDHLGNMAVDSTSVYWTRQSDADGGAGSIMHLWPK